MVISDRDVKFTSKFWKSIFVDLERNINFITSYHPRRDGQIGRKNQVIGYVEDICHGEAH